MDREHHYVIGSVLISNNHKGSAEDVQKADYFCEYSLWRLFFEDQYKAYMVEQERLDAEALEQQRREAGTPDIQKTVRLG